MTMVITSAIASSGSESVLGSWDRQQVTATVVERLCFNPFRYPSPTFGFVSSPQHSIRSYSLDSYEMEEPTRVKDGPGLMTIAECLHHLLEIIGGFLVDSPQDIGRLFYLTSRCLGQQANFAMDSLWHDAYELKWKPFCRLIQFQNERRITKDWYTLYKETLNGKTEFVLEVFDRQKKAGFAMSAMPARVYYEKSEDGFVAWYMSASQVPPELIPMSEQHRLRACPTSTLDRLCHVSSNVVSEVPFERRWKSSCMDHERSISNSQDLSCKDRARSRSNSQDSLEAEQPSYPYSVLGTTEGLVVGEPVELQWKMQGKSPFGWWFGLLESLRFDKEGPLATAIIIFPHFDPTSQWYRLSVRIGDGEIRACALGGKSGGLRPVSTDEQHQWMRHFPAHKTQDP